jgi:hypothetical protein
LVSLNSHTNFSFLDTTSLHLHLIRAEIYFNISTFGNFSFPYTTSLHLIPLEIYFNISTFDSLIPSEIYFTCFMVNRVFVMMEIVFIKYLIPLRVYFTCFMVQLSFFNGGNRLHLQLLTQTNYYIVQSLNTTKRSILKLWGEYLHRTQIWLKTWNTLFLIPNSLTQIWLKTWNPFFDYKVSCNVVDQSKIW